MLLSLTTACAGSTPAPTQRALVVALPGASPATLAAAAPMAVDLSRSTGVPVKLQAPPAAALAADLRDGKVDAALVADPLYVSLAGMAPVRVVAQAASAPVTPVVICNASSGVAALTDGGDWTSLRGKSVLFGPTGSLPTNRWPRYFMNRNGVDPIGDLSDVRVEPDERRALLDVYDGIADCMTAPADDRGHIADIAPDAAARLTVAFAAPVAVPPPPVVVRAGLSTALQRKLAAALAGIAPGSPASAAMNGAAGFASARPAGDRDYAALRAVLLNQALPPAPSPAPTPTSR